MEPKTFYEDYDRSHPIFKAVNGDGVDGIIYAARLEDGTKGVNIESWTGCETGASSFFVPNDRIAAMNIALIQHLISRE